MRASRVPEADSNIVYQRYGEAAAVVCVKNLHSRITYPASFVKQGVLFVVHSIDFSAT